MTCRSENEETAGHGCSPGGLKCGCPPRWALKRLLASAFQRPGGLLCCTQPLSAAVKNSKNIRVFRPRELAAESFTFYEAFRPAVPEGVKGRGAKGVLDLGKIRLLAKG